MLSSYAQVVLIPSLLWVVLSDLLYRRIANRLVVGLLLLWMLGAGLSCWLGNSAQIVGGLSSSLLAAALVLIGGYLLFCMRWVGAGDVKLMAVLCLWLGSQAFSFLMITSLAGGVLALAMPLLRLIETPLALGVARLAETLRIHSWPALQEHAIPGIPYGIAIALGAGFVLYTA